MALSSEAIKPTNPLLKIVFNYYRLLINHKNVNKGKFNFLTWGYFDRLKVSYVGPFNDLFSEELEKENYKNNKDYEIHRLCSYTIDYELADLQAFLGIREEKPLIVITEMKINEKIFNSRSDLLEAKEILRNQKEHIASILNSAIYKNRLNLDYRILSTLGYSDYAIIFRGEDYQQIIDQINNIRNLRESATQNNKEYLFRSTYSIAGVELNSVKYLTNKHPYNISLRLSLRRNINFSKLKDNINKSLGSNYKDVSITTVYGKYDFDLYFKNFGLSSYIRLFDKNTSCKKEAILDLQSEFHKNFLGYTNTRLLLEIPNISDENQNMNMNDQIFEKKQPLLKSPTKFINSQSINNAFEQMIKNYYQIENNEASESLLLSELRKIIVNFIEQINESHKEISHLTDPDRSIAVQDYYFDIEKGLELINQLLNSRIQAFRLYSEIPSYDPHYIRSATKLFILYMTIVEEVERVINSIYAEETKYKFNPKEINLFVTLSEFDTVETGYLFPTTSKKLVPIQLSKNSFCDLQFNLLLLVHEISHYLPIPNNLEHNKTILEIVSNDIAVRLVHKIITGSDNSVILNSELPNRNIIGAFYTEFSNFFANQLWNNIDYKDYSENEFSNMLPKTITNLNSLINKSVNNKCDLFIDYLNHMESKNIHIQEFERLYERLIQKLINYEDISNLLHMWQSEIFESEAVDIIHQTELRILNKKWKEIIVEVEKRRSELHSLWESFLSDSIYPLINYFKLNPRFSAIDEKLLKHFAHCYLIERTDENKYQLSEEILRYLNAETTRIQIDMNVDKFVDIVKESSADYLMCNLLDLNWNIYQKLILDYHNNYLTKANENGFSELDYRSIVLSQTQLFCNNPLADSNSEVIAYGLRFENIVNYLDSLNKINIPLEKIRSLPSIKCLKNFFESNKNNPQYLQGGNEIQLIENIWSIGMGLF